MPSNSSDVVPRFALICLIILSVLTIARAEEPNANRTDNIANKSEAPNVSESAAKTSDTPNPSPKRLTINGMTITFTGDNEAVVEANGQTVKINTSLQSVADLAGTSGQTPTTPPPAGASESNPKAAAAPDKEKTDEIDPETYYGFELVNVPTPRTYEKHAFSVHFTHRFAQSPFVKAAPDLFGFDSFSASAFGFSYGITDRFFAKIYRT